MPAVWLACISVLTMADDISKTDRFAAVVRRDRDAWRASVPAVFTPEQGRTLADKAIKVCRAHFFGDDPLIVAPKISPSAKAGFQKALDDLVVVRDGLAVLVKRGAGATPIARDKMPKLRAVLLERGGALFAATADVSAQLPRPTSAAERYTPNLLADLEGVGLLLAIGVGWLLWRELAGVGRRARALF
jgi:hypothetical protein